MSTLLPRIRVLLLVALVAVAGAGCGGDDGAGGDRTGASDDRSRADGTSAAGDAEDGGSDRGDDAPEADGGPAPLPPIEVIAPPTFSSVHRSFVLRGTAQVHEGELRWAILDADLEALASGRMMASCGAPCRGKFSTRVDVSKVPVGSWELHVFAPPVADSDPPRVHDVILPITVVANPVDQPAADAPPPGGVPNDL